MRNPTTHQVTALVEFLRRHRRLTVLSGAGCSTGSGIPDYRDENGEWKHAQPVQYADFVSSEMNRKRYWSRSFAGWERISGARPNAAHRAIAALEHAGRVECLITQNVDNLHYLAGSRQVIDLHGLLHRVRCLACGAISKRDSLQRKLRALNPRWTGAPSAYLPDGDASLAHHEHDRFKVPSCSRCDGVLKPDVVFFGEPIPAERVQIAAEKLSQSDALLVVGSSLMVWSGYRFARNARAAGKPIAIVNRGTTRADKMSTCKIEADCAEVLQRTVRELDRASAGNR